VKNGQKNILPALPGRGYSYIARSTACILVFVGLVGNGIWRNR
jgi:hypothetical protein